MNASVGAESNLSNGASMYGKSAVITFLDANTDRQTRSVVQSNSRYVSDLSSFEKSFYRLGRTFIDSMASSAGITPAALAASYRNNGVNPATMNAVVGSGWTDGAGVFHAEGGVGSFVNADGSPVSAATANAALAGIEAASTGGVVPSWLLWLGGGLAFVLAMGGGGSLLGASRRLRLRRKIGSAGGRQVWKGALGRYSNFRSRMGRRRRR